MFVKIWGSRGSIPVCGAEYVKYGGDTTCIEIRSKSGKIIIIDAGTGLRRLGKALLTERIIDYDLIFTHAHWDHVLGFPFFRPLYLDGSVLRLHGCPFARGFVQDMLKKVMSPPTFPVCYEDLKARLEYVDDCPERFDIDSVAVETIALSHPGGGKGYKFVEDGKSFVFITDNELGYAHPGGLAYKQYVDFCAGADLLIHDAEFTAEEYPRYRTWGHSSYMDALGLAMDAEVKDFTLFHLNQDRTDKALDRITDHCRRIVKENRSQVVVYGACCDMTFQL